jgi:hypothetical protein
MTDYSALAREFVAALRAHGHDPRVSSDGSFGIRIGVLTPTAPISDDFILGFDTRPFAVLRDCLGYVDHLVDAALTTGDADD